MAEGWGECVDLPGSPAYTVVHMLFVHPSFQKCCQQQELNKECRTAQANASDTACSSSLVCNNRIG
eukprot:1142665-Pelagomonas_calceolata.AAC.1